MIASRGILQFIFAFRESGRKQGGKKSGQGSAMYNIGSGEGQNSTSCFEDRTRSFGLIWLFLFRIYGNMHFRE